LAIETFDEAFSQQKNEKDRYVVYGTESVIAFVCAKKRKQNINKKKEKRIIFPFVIFDVVVYNFLMA
jgi:hypothetical protein